MFLQNKGYKGTFFANVYSNIAKLKYYTIKMEQTNNLEVENISTKALWCEICHDETFRSDYTFN